MDIVKQWKKTHHPNLKLKNYLAHRGLWDEEKETALVKSVDADVKVSRMVKLFRDVIPTFLQASSATSSARLIFRLVNKVDAQ